VGGRGGRGREGEGAKQTSLLEHELFQLSSIFEVGCDDGGGDDDLPPWMVIAAQSHSL